MKPGALRGDGAVNDPLPCPVTHTDPARMLFFVINEEKNVSQREGPHQQTEVTAQRARKAQNESRNKAHSNPGTGKHCFGWKVTRTLSFHPQTLNNGRFLSY